MSGPLKLAQMLTDVLADCQTPEEVEVWATYLRELADRATNHANRLRADLDRVVVSPAASDNSSG
jgi:hypothetical protein